jgi:hypothetical protein
MVIHCRLLIYQFCAHHYTVNTILPQIWPIPWTGENTRREVRNESAAEFADHMKKARLDEKEALEKAAQKMKWSYDKHA